MKQKGLALMGIRTTNQAWLDPSEASSIPQNLHFGALDTQEGPTTHKDHGKEWGTAATHCFKVEDQPPEVLPGLHSSPANRPWGPPSRMEPGSPDRSSSMRMPRVTLWHFRGAQKEQSPSCKPSRWKFPLSFPKWKVTNEIRSCPLSSLGYASFTEPGVHTGLWIISGASESD